MIYQFGPFELDIATVELREGDKACNLEPQVFSLLALLVENRERLVSKEEIIDTVWDGRVVSDAALASRVKSARQALGDTGKSQRFIRTIHGKGYRFVTDARASRGTAARSAVVSTEASVVESTSAANLHLNKPSRPPTHCRPQRPSVFRHLKIKPRWPPEWRFLHESESPAQSSSQTLEGVRRIRRDLAVFRQEVST